MAPPKKKSCRVPSTQLMVSSAIKCLGNPDGSSYTAIKRYIASKYIDDLDMASLDENLKDYLKKSVQCGKLIQTSGTGARGSFRIGTASPKAGRGSGSSRLNLRKEVAAKPRKAPVLAQRVSKACTARQSGSKRAHTTSSKSQAKPKKRFARNNKEKSSSSAKKTKVSPKFVPLKEAYKFFLALVSGDGQQIKAFEDYLTTPFLISVQTAESINCRCVNGRLSEIQAMLSPLPMMKRLLEGTCPGIKCTRNRIDGYETQSTTVKFYPLHVAAATGDLELFATILSKNPDMYISSSPAQYYPFELALKHGNHHVGQNLLDRGFSYKSPRSTRQYEQEKYCVRMDRVVQGAMDNSDLIPILKVACLADAMLHNKEWQIAVRISLNDNDLPLLENLFDREVGDCSEIIVQKDKCVLSLAKCADAVNMIFDAGFVPERFLEARREVCLEKGKICWPEEFNEKTETILHQIIREERFDIAEAAIKNCPELMAEVGVSDVRCLITSPRSSMIMKPLHMCALRCDYDGLKLLIENGANVNELSTGVDGRSIVHYLCFPSCSVQHQTKCFNLIMETGFTGLDLRDKFGFTALLYATVSYNIPLLNLLLANGADPTISLARRSHSTVLGNLAERNDQTNRFSVILPVLYSNVLERCMTPQQRDGNPKEKVTPQVISLEKEDIPSVRAFIESGWFIHEALKDPKVEQCLKTWSAKNLNWIQDVHLSSVPSLQWWSKRAIRKMLPLFPSKIVQALTLPEPMKKYIMKVDDLPPKEAEMLENFEWLPHESDEEGPFQLLDDEYESSDPLSSSSSSSGSWNGPYGYNYDYDERPYWS